MATEFEELKLQVSLVDNASPQIEGLKKSFANLGDTKLTQQFDKLKGHGVELGDVLKVATKGMGGLSEASELAARGIGWVGSSVAAVGATVALEVKALNDYASAYQHLGQLSKITGIDPGTFKALREGFAEAGVGAGEAEKNISGMAQAMAEIGKRESPLRQSVLKGLHGEDLAAMQQSVTQLMAAAATGNATLFANTLKHTGDQIYQGNLARYGSVERAAAARTSYLGQFGAQQLVQVTKDFDELSDTEKAREQERVNKANEFLGVVHQIKHAFEEVGVKFQTEVLPIITQELQPVSESLKNWAKDLKPEEMQKFADMLKEAADSVKSVFADLKAIADFWNGLKGLKDQVVTAGNQALRTATGGVIPDVRRTEPGVNEPAPGPGGESDNKWNWFFDKTISKLPFGVGPWLKSQQQQFNLPPVTAPRQQLPSVPGAKPFELPSVTTPGLPGTLPGTLQPAPVVPKEALPPTFESRWPPPPATFESRWPPPLPPPEPPKLPPPPEHGRIWELLQHPLGGQPAVQPERFTGGGAPMTADEKRQFDVALKQPRPEIPDIGQAIKLPRPGALPDMGPRLPVTDAQRDIMRPIVYPPPLAPDWLSNIDPRTGRPQDQPSAAERVVGPSIADLDLDRSALYRAMRNETIHKVEGKAKISVDVNAPPGTAVDAESEGMFAPTDIHRQFQMERSASTVRRPAVQGPR